MTLAPHVSGIELSTNTELFKQAFGAHPAGVAIITAVDAQGNPAGLTASSVSSISADPAIIGFSLKGNTGSAATILGAQTLLVHLLDAENVQLAKNFATSGCPRFEDPTTWETLTTGEPLLHGVRRVLRVTPISKAEADPAIVITAQVENFVRHDLSGTPLVYHSRKFHALGEHSEVR